MNPKMAHRGEQNEAFFKKLNSFLESKCQASGMLNTRSPQPFCATF
jgi:hypothetical protein